MRTWESFFADVLPDVPGCPEPTVERHLMRAAREFCAKTGCWRDDLPAITTREGRADYSIAYPDGADGVTLVGATLNGQDIELEVVDATTAAERRRGNAGPTRVLTEDLRVATLMPTPAAGLPLVLTMRLQPAESAQGLPEHLAERYGLEIATGALASLLKINKAPWANPGLAVDKDGLFRQRIGQVRTAMWKAHTNSRPRVRAQYF